MDTKNKKSIPLGIKNNNPLNIVYNNRSLWIGLLAGQKGRFCAFTEAKWGFRAAAYLIRKYIQKYQRNTIRSIINAWAPPCENDTKNYAEFVSKETGIDLDEKLEFSDMTRILRLMSAMCVMENGREYDPQNDSVLWKALYEGYIMAREGKLAKGL